LDVSDQVVEFEIGPLKPLDFGFVGGGDELSFDQGENHDHDPLDFFVINKRGLAVHGDDNVIAGEMVSIDGADNDGWHAIGIRSGTMSRYGVIGECFEWGLDFENCGGKSKRADL
jgi:hypothetical protein